MIIKKKVYEIIETSDRYGSNIIRYLTTYLFAHRDNCNFNLKTTTNRFKNNFYFKYLMKKQKQQILTKNNIAESFKTNNSGWELTPVWASFQEKYKMSIGDYINKTEIKKDCLNEFLLYARHKKYKIDWDKDNTIVIHLRLGDVYEQYLSGVGRWEGQTQDIMKTEDLISLITKLFDKYKGTKINLISSPNKNDIIYCKNICKKFNNKNIFYECDNDIDLSIWKMINSKILIMSKSLFSLLAGVFHMNNNVYTYATWEHFDEITLYKNKYNCNTFKILKLD